MSITLDACDETRRIERIRATEIYNKLLYKNEQDLGQIVLYCDRKYRTGRTIGEKGYLRNKVLYATRRIFETNNIPEAAYGGFSYDAIFDRAVVDMSDKYYSKGKCNGRIVVKQFIFSKEESDRKGDIYKIICNFILPGKRKENRYFDVNDFIYRDPFKKLTLFALLIKYRARDINDRSITLQDFLSTYLTNNIILQLDPADIPILIDKLYTAINGLKDTRHAGFDIKIDKNNNIIDINTKYRLDGLRDDFNIDTYWNKKWGDIALDCDMRSEIDMEEKIIEKLCDDYGRRRT